MHEFASAYGVRPTDVMRGRLGDLFLDATVFVAANEVKSETQRLLSTTPDLTDPVGHAINAILARRQSRARGRGQQRRRRRRG